MDGRNPLLYPASTAAWIAQIARAADAYVAVARELSAAATDEEPDIVREAALAEAMDDAYAALVAAIEAAEPHRQRAAG